MTSRLSSPRYLRSCGAEPSVANWKIRLPWPIVVLPSITACDLMRVPLPIRTPGPMTLYGPTSTSRSSSARGSTRAVSWILVMLPASPRTLIHGDLHRRDFRLRRDFSIDLGDALHFPERSAPLEARELEPELVAGLDGPLEFHLVQAGQNEDILAVAAAPRDISENRRDLGHRLADQHARHHRMVGKMALKKTLVGGYVFDADDPLVPFDLDDPVD